MMINNAANITACTTANTQASRARPVTDAVNNAARAMISAALTATEIGILRTLLRRPGSVLSRDSLMDGAYAVERVVSDRTIDSHIRRVRAKFAAIGANPIETLPGFGYRLAACR